MFYSHFRLWISIKLIDYREEYLSILKGPLITTFVVYNDRNTVRMKDPVLAPQSCIPSLVAIVFSLKAWFFCGMALYGSLVWFTCIPNFNFSKTYRRNVICFKSLFLNDNITHKKYNFLMYFHFLPTQTMCAVPHIWSDCVGNI